MHLFKRLMVLILILLIAVGCSPVVVETSPPPGSPAADTEQPTPAPNQPPAEPSVQPTETTPMRAEEILHIAQPGTNSVLVSPVSVQGLAKAPFESQLGITLTDINGQELAAVYPTVQAQMGETGPYQAELNFTIEEDDQPARITVFTTSPKDGGLTHANSVVVQLRMNGESQLAPITAALEQIDISSPASGETVSGGVLTVNGLSEYFFEANLSLMLCGEGGSGEAHKICGTADNVLAEGFAMIESPDMGVGGPFSGSLTYTVAQPVNARLVVYALSPMDGAIAHLSSVNITLAP